MKVGDSIKVLLFSIVKVLKKYGKWFLKIFGILFLKSIDYLLFDMSAIHFGLEAGHGWNSSTLFDLD